MSAKFWQSMSSKMPGFSNPSKKTNKPPELRKHLQPSTDGCFLLRIYTTLVLEIFNSTPIAAKVTIKAEDP